MQHQLRNQRGKRNIALVVRVHEIGKKVYPTASPALAKTSFGSFSQIGMAKGV